MLKIYIIGSLSRAKTIQRVAERIKENGNFDVDYVCKEPRKTHERLIWECFDKIEAANVIIAVKKASGDFGDGTLYEMEYARRVGKKLLMTDGSNIGSVYAYLCVNQGRISLLKDHERRFIEIGRMHQQHWHRDKD